MVTTAGIIFALLVVAAVFLFLARKLLRIALKIAVAMAIVFVLVVGAAVGWWRGWFETSKKNHIPATTTNKRAPANHPPR